MKTVSRLLFICLLLALCAAGYAAFETWRFLSSAPANPGEGRIFDVEAGAGFAKTAEQLEKKGLTTDAFKLRLLARWKKWDSRMQAGRFQLHTGLLPEELLDRLVNGQPLLYRLTLREGLSWWETAKIIEEAGFARADDFRAVIFDPEFLRRHGIPFFNAEGFLFPDTYLLKKPDILDQTAARAVANRLVETFFHKASPLWPEGVPLKGQELRRILIIASIVEKESALAEERPRIAGVYMNRIKINMPLQADPTVIYGLGQNFSGNLRRTQLDDAGNIYNTYRISGLPPGPICSPGISALKATLAPERHNFLYFVAKGDGGHVFSSDLREHNRAVRQWIMTQRGQPQKEQTP